MKKKILKVATLIVATAILTGCSADKMSSLNAQKELSLNSESSYMSTKISREGVMDKKLSINLKKEPVYLAIKKVAKKLNVAFDTTFVPSEEYMVSTNFRGTLGEFLENVYEQTNVIYAYRNGFLTVTNKGTIEEQYRAKQCNGKAPTVTVSLKNVPPMDVFKYFSDRYAYSFTFDTKYYNIGSNDVTKATLRNTSLYYKGCDAKEALRQFARASDFHIETKRGKKISVQDYVTVNLEVPTYFDLAFKSAGSGIGEDDTGTKLEIKEEYRKNFQKFIKTHLTKKGKAYVSNRGYIAVTDIPSVVRGVKKLVNEEVKHQRAMKLNVSIIRIDVKNEYSAGVDWDLALEQIGKQFNVRALSLGVNYSNQVAGGFSIGGITNNKQQILKLLGKYGNTKIVRDFHTKARGGIVSTFKAVEQIPYVTTSVLQNQGVSEVVTEAKVAESGLIINIVPTISNGGNTINIATDITVSEYLGDKIFNVNGGEYILPRIAISKIQMPAVVRANQSIVLTGLKLRKKDLSGEGVPKLVQNKNYGEIFGLKNDSGQSSEFLVIITPETLRSY